MLHSLGAFALHILGKVAVNVQCKGRSGVSQIGLKRFDVITGTNAVHCIIVAQIVDTQVGQPDFLNDTLVGIVDPDIAQESIDGDMSVPAGSDMTTPPDDGSMQKFPAFEGKDLDGNTVKSSELFSKNAVTVVNFWFTTCNPCVGELAELDTLNKELTEKGGALIGVNTFTLDGDEAAISEAKNVLAKKGATYQNVYFASDGEAGKFTTNIFAYPTTYVVDRNGNIVGDPIVGAITEKKQAEELQAQIDKALSADMG